MSGDPKHESTATETTQPEITSDEERELEEEKNKREAEELKQKLRSLDDKTKKILSESAESVRRNRTRPRGGDGDNEDESTIA